MKGYIQVYTGDGKGKTTASFGLAIRSALAGKKVYIGQFVKGMEYSELKIEKLIADIEIHQFGQDCFIYEEPTEKDILIAREGLKECEKILEEGNHDLVILDELNIALYYNLFSVEEVIKILKARKAHVEVVITGRNAPEELIEIADLVTKMKEVKHYYNDGVEAREGIEF